jgi:hypothetical protein
VPSVAVTQPSVRIIKQFTWRGQPKLVSNRYYFDGAAPADNATWYALFDQLVTQESAIFSNAVVIVGAHGYAPGSDVAVANKTYSTLGVLSASGLAQTPGECAAVLRMATTKRTGKNHPVYCFSYYHKAMYSTSVGTADDLAPSQKAAIDVYGLAWVNGITIGSRTYHRTTPDGALTTGRTTLPNIHHRDFPG